MTWRACGLSLGLAAAIGLACAEPPAGSGGSPFTLIVLTDVRPVLLRVHADLNGKTVAAQWNDCLEEVFRFADRNSDGALDSSELSSLRPVLMATGLSPVLPVRRIDTDRDGLVSRQEFLHWMSRQVPNGVRFQPARLGADDPGSDDDILFNLLDGNGDGKLDESEVRQIPQILSRLDQNEDELITLMEIRQFSGQAPTMPDERQPSPQRRPKPRSLLPVYLAAAEDPAAEWVPEMMNRYAGPHPSRLRTRRLSREQLGMDAAAFALLDADKDGELDQEELRRFAEIPADLEVEVRFHDEQGTSTISVRRWRSDLKVTSEGNVVLVALGRSRLEITVPASGKIRTARELASREHASARSRFMTLDRDRNGYLTAEEVLSESDFRDFFADLDADGDGKLLPKELEAWLDRYLFLTTKAAASQLLVHTRETSGMITNWLDPNRDGRITLREARRAVETLLPLAQDGGLSKAALPMVVRMRIGPAASLTGSLDDGPLPADARPGLPSPTASAPLWFQKMDRNHDGDVSLREFLGPLERFREIDADGDGLISVEEAARFEAKHRPPR